MYTDAMQRALREMEEKCSARALAEVTSLMARVGSALKPAATGEDAVCDELLTSHAEFARAALASGRLSEAALAQQVAALLTAGQSVVLTGLSTAGLNGLVGVVADTRLREENRVPVHVVSQGVGKRLLVRLRNIQPSLQPARAAAAYALSGTLQVEQPGTLVSPHVAFVEGAGGDVTVTAAAPIELGTQVIVVQEDACLRAWSADVRDEVLEDGVTMGEVLDSVSRRCAEASSGGPREALEQRGGLLAPLAPEEVQLVLVVMRTLAADTSARLRVRASWPSARERCGLPLLWRGALLERFRATTVGAQLEVLRRKAESVFFAAVEPELTARGLGRLLAARELGSDLRATFMHALALVKSRAIAWPRPQPSGELGGEWGLIPPVADLFNGLPARDGLLASPSGQSAQTVELLILKLGDAPPAVCFRATRDVSAGEELLACYAADSTAAFLCKYGVVPQATHGWRNPLDEVGQ